MPKLVFSKLRIKNLLLLAVALPCLLALDYLVLFFYARNATVAEANKILNQAQSGITVTDGEIDSRKLLNDLMPPYPYIVVEENGQVIDRANIKSGVFDAADYEKAKEFASPTTFSASKFVNWRLYSLPITYEGQELGVVLVGAYLGESPNFPKEIDQLLISSAKQIANTLKYENGSIDASGVKAKDINPFVSAYAIISKDNYILPGGFGAMPTLVPEEAVSRLKNDLRPNFINAAETYLTLGREADFNGQKVILSVAIPFTQTKRLLDLQVQVVLLLFILIILIGILPLIRRFTAFEPEAIDKALSAGEGQKIEFKEMLPAGNALAKHIAGFANSEGGTLFIGINDDGKVVGIDGALNLNQKWQNGDKMKKGLSSKDRLTRTVSQDIRSLISPAPEIKVDVIKHKGLEVMRIHVPKGRDPIYSVSGAVYIRHGNQTVPAKSEEILRLIRQ